MNNLYTPFNRTWGGEREDSRFCSQLVEIYPRVWNNAEFGGTTAESSIEYISLERSIIAIHGLASNSTTAWTTSGGVNWLRDFLPGDMSQSDEAKLPFARIMTFGYNAEVVFSKDWRLISDQAGDLLELLRCAARDSSGYLRPRPIVFVCHSQGGILFKQAVILSEKSADHPLQYLKGVIFLGTPHHGSRSTLIHLSLGVSKRINYLKYEKELKNKYEKENPTKLKSDLGILSSINERFWWLISDGFTFRDENGREEPRSFGIRNFYESKKMHKISMIVDKEASNLRFDKPPRVETKKMENVDHIQISKFQTRDRNYETVLAGTIYMFRQMQNDIDRTSGKGLAATLANRQLLEEYENRELQQEDGNTGSIEDLPVEWEDPWANT